MKVRVNKMDMQLYALLTKDLSDFESVSGYILKEVKELPETLESNVIYIVNPNKEGEE
jgi:hypothetical protein